MSRDEQCKDYFIQVHDGSGAAPERSKWNGLEADILEKARAALSNKNSVVHVFEAKLLKSYRLECQEIPSE